MTVAKKTQRDGSPDIHSTKDDVSPRISGRQQPGAAKNTGNKNVK